MFSARERALRFRADFFVKIIDIYNVVWYYIIKTTRC